MELEKIREAFHALFNKINNIFTAVGSNKAVFEENLDRLSPQELKARVKDMCEAMRVIDKNILILNDSLQEVYEALKKEKEAAGPSDPSRSK